MQNSLKFFLVISVSFLFILFSCASEKSEKAKKGASIPDAKVVNDQNASVNRSNANDHYGADIKTLTVFTVNWILRIKEDGSGSFGQGQNGNLYAKFPNGTFNYSEVVETMTNAKLESGSFGQSVAFTVSGGAKVQKPNYVENFDYCASLFTQAYNKLTQEEKAKVEEVYKRTPPVSAYNH